MDNDDKGVLIRKDGWCIVGVGGDTESGDCWKRCPMDIGSLGLVEALSASCEPRVIFGFVITSRMATCFWGFLSGCSPGSFKIKRGRV